MKVELLAPAGNMEAFKAALQNGADAIFLGGKMYGARASAANFSLEEIKEAVQLAHLYGVKVHVTLNTLIKQSEFEACKQYIHDLYEANVDALIVQDLGVVSFIRTHYPDFEIHASTQMHIHNLESLRQVKKWGIHRAVVARETPVSLIKEMCKQGIEIEVFVQGAYCVSYSGQCQMSQNIGGRSANRGECAQACRLPYTLVKDTPQGKMPIQAEGKYLLSLKDLNAIKMIPDLIQAGVTSFKIEGRMKRPEYVAMMTRVYRQAIDAFYANQTFDVNQQIIEEMQKVFNRGFSEGYLTHTKGKALTSSVRPNHQGILIGKVAALNKDKMSIALHHELNQKDGIRILNEKGDIGFVVNYMYRKGQLINHAANEVIELERVKGVKVNDLVVKTSDVKQLQALNKTIDANLRKVALYGKVSAHFNEPFQLEVRDDEGFVSVIQSEQKVEKALKTPLTSQRIEAQLKKTGNTAFAFEQIEWYLDENISFPISVLNELRRTLLEAHATKRSLRKRNTAAIPYCLKPVHSKITRVQSVTVSTMEQYEIVKNYDVHIDVMNRHLYEQIHALDARVQFVYPKVYHLDYEVDGLVSELGGLQKENVRVNTSLNCFNASAIAFLLNQKVSCITLSDELSDHEIQDLMAAYIEEKQDVPNVEKIIYERKENMIMEHCPVNCFVSDTQKKNCRLCHHSQYYLVDAKQKAYPLRGDENCLMHVYHSEICDELNKKSMYEAMGITNFRVIFTFENAKEVSRVMERFLQA